MPEVADARRKALAALLGEIRVRPRSTDELPGVGHYAGFVRAGRAVVAVTTDTVGTKAILAEQLDRWEEVGEDLVTINTNDLCAVGSRPLALVDTLSIPSPDVARFRAIGRGMERGLRAAGCVLLGGETAVVPDLVRHPDLGGTAIGDFPGSRRPITGETIRPGDLVVGLRANGFHANGYTLIRQVLKRNSVNLSRFRRGSARSLGRELLEPTRPYTRASEALAGLAEVHGLAHITGGGVRNLVRIRTSVRFMLDGWPEPYGLYEWVEQAGRIARHRLYETFNMGIGFVVVISPTGWKRVQARLGRVGFRDAVIVGAVTRGQGVELPHLGLRYRGYA